MADRLISPLAATFVRASQPGEDKFYATAQDRLRVQSGEVQAFLRFRVSLPDRLDLLSLTFEVFSEEDNFVGNLTAREVDLSGPTYKRMTWNNRPSPRAGSSDRVLAEDGRRLYVDVTNDYGATLLEDGSISPWLAYRLSSSISTKQWLVGPSAGRFAPRLRMVTQPRSFDPFDLSPAGNVGVLKPVFTWTVPLERTHVQLQVDELGGDFSTPLYDTGELANPGGSRNTVSVNTTLYASWAGIPAGGASVRARHKVSSGWSDWQEVEVSYVAKQTVTLSNPGVTDADPTPPMVWSPAAASAEVLVWRGADLIHESGMLPGPVSTYTPPKGARTEGEEIRRELRFYDGVTRAASFGDPPYVSVSRTTAYVPTATVAGLDGLTVWQDRSLPVVEIGFTRTAGVPDEVSVERGGEELYRLPGTDFPVRDWTFRPNADVPVIGRAVVNGAHSEVAAELTAHIRVTGAWLVDPETERGFVLATEGGGAGGLSIGTEDVVVVNSPISAATMLRRTLVLRDESGSMQGMFADWPGRTVEEQMADALWLRERTRTTLRLIVGDLNIPVTASIGKPTMFDPASWRPEVPRWGVAVSFSHAGDE